MTCAEKSSGFQTLKNSKKGCNVIELFCFLLVRKDTQANLWIFPTVHRHELTTSKKS
jgi:hypothetical protein